jgi:hypothetical protein
MQAVGLKECGSDVLLKVVGNESFEENDFRPDLRDSYDKVVKKWKQDARRDGPL